MDIILTPIRAYSETEIDMMSSDGVWRWCHPVQVAFVGDYSEQMLVTCTYGSRCPKCTVPTDQLGSLVDFPLWDADKALPLCRGAKVQFNSVQFSNH
jgi:hypothetical protein